MGWGVPTYERIRTMSLECLCAWVSAAASRSVHENAIGEADAQISCQGPLTRSVTRAILHFVAN